MGDGMSGSDNWHKSRVAIGIGIAASVVSILAGIQAMAGFDNFGDLARRVLAGSSPTPSPTPSRSISIERPPPPVQDEPTREPSIFEKVRTGDCVHDNGDNKTADLESADCTSGAFKIVRIFSGTADSGRCNDIDDGDRAVSSNYYERVLCLSYISPDGTAFHADQGDCVYGRSISARPWGVQSCQTGNFKVLAVYRGTTDDRKCNDWPRYNMWKRFDVKGHPELSVLLCLSMNYPDDAGYAEQRDCLRKSGNVFTNVGSCDASNVYITGRTNRYNDTKFCGNHGTTTWRHADYPAYSYTVCWQWIGQ